MFGLKSNKLIFMHLKLSMWIKIIWFGASRVKSGSENFNRLMVYFQANLF